MENKKEKVYLTTLSIECGIITLIDMNGLIVKYRQRGITDIDEDKKRIYGGLAILMFYACKYTTVAMTVLTKKIALLLKKCFTKKEEN